MQKTDQQVQSNVEYEWKLTKICFKYWKLMDIKCWNLSKNRWKSLKIGYSFDKNDRKMPKIYQK